MFGLFVAVVCVRELKLGPRGSCVLARQALCCGAAAGPEAGNSESCVFTVRDKHVLLTAVLHVWNGILSMFVLVSAPRSLCVGHHNYPSRPVAHGYHPST